MPAPSRDELNKGLEDVRRRRAERRAAIARIEAEDESDRTLEGVYELALRALGGSSQAPASTVETPFSSSVSAKSSAQFHERQPTLKAEPRGGERVASGMWETFICEQIDAEGFGLTPTDIFRLAQGHPAFSGVNLVKNMVHQALKKLTDKGVLTRKTERYYTPALLQKLGLSNYEGSGRDSFLVRAILQVPELSDWMNSADIIASIRANPEVNAKTWKGAGSIYNALARLHGNGRLEKENGRYKLSPLELVQREAKRPPGKTPSGLSGQENGSDPLPGFNPARPAH